MSPSLIRYPTGWTLAVVPDIDRAEAAASELRTSGVGTDDVAVLAGPDASTHLDRLGTSRGLPARIRRSVQFMTMDQLPDLHVYELALSRGMPVLGIRVPDTERRRAAIDVVRRNGGHFINRFGAWATEEIAPWRGEPLPVGQLMQR